MKRTTLTQNVVAMRVAGACALCLAIVAFAPQLTLRAVAAIVLRASGYTLAYDRLDIHSSELTGGNVRISTAAGEPVAKIQSIRATYSLSDWVRGQRAFGLKSIDLEHPQFTLSRHRDGTWNVPIPSQNNTASNAALDFSGLVNNGAIDVFDQAQGVVAARHLEIRDINVRTYACSRCRTWYAARLAYMEAGRPYVVVGNGNIDPASGIAVQHWQAAALPIAHIVDVALNSPSFHISNGVLHNLDANADGFFDGRGALDNHVSITTRLENGKLAIGGLIKPLRDVSGPIAVYDDGIVFPNLRATLAGAPVRASGGIYNLRDPSMRLTVAAVGDLRDLRTAIAQTASVPISGAGRLQMLVEGHPSDALMTITLDSPQVMYANSVLNDVAGRIAFDGHEADVLNLHARTIDDVSAVIRGKVSLRRGPGAMEMLGVADLPQVPMRGFVLATSDTLQSVDAEGALTGSLRDRHLRGVFSVNGQGIGTIGPLSAQLGNGSLYALASVDRPHQMLQADVSSNNFPLAAFGVPTHLNGDVSAAYTRGVLRLGGVAATGSAYADVNGTISKLLSGAPHYALTGNLNAAEVAPFISLVNPSLARIVEGRASVQARVIGNGEPSFVGTLRSQEGAVNGLAYHNLRATFSGSPSTVALRAGSVGVATTNVAFAANVAPRTQSVTLDAPHADLADFNDFFDAGDMLGGTGSVSGAASFSPGSLASGGRVALHNARVHGFALGALSANWHTSRGLIATNLAFAGDNGAVRASGGVGTNGTLYAMNVHARNVDLGRWLEMAGYAEPISGRFVADAVLNGPMLEPYGSIAFHAAHASIANLPIDSLAGGGRFGVAAGAPLDLAVDAHTAHLALAGASADNVVTHIRARGTRSHPVLDDRIAASNVTYGGMVIPKIIAMTHADTRTVSLVRGEVDLQHGSILASGSAPITMRTVMMNVTARGVELADVEPLLPPGATLAGQIDGNMKISGSPRNPNLTGLVNLAHGTFASPLESVPITDANAKIAFAGNTVTLRDAHAVAGKGTLDAQGRATVANVLHPENASINATVTAHNASIDVPAYVKGTFNGQLSLARQPGADPKISGDVASDWARIPVTALYNPGGSSATPPMLPNLGLNVKLHAGRDVRVQSPNVDIGARGDIAANGTLRAPVLAGTFRSTDGTVSFGRTFNIERARVRFDPSSGMVPDVRARATTYVDEPSTDIALRVAGPADRLNLSFDSSPQYSRDQILGLLALGGNTNGGLNPPNAIASLAGGQLNELFTRNLLEPFSVALGGALGLKSLQISNDLEHGMGIHAVKALGKLANLVFSDSFGEPRRMSLSLLANPSRGARIDLTTYTADRPVFVVNGPILPGPNAIGNFTTFAQETGTSGTSFVWMKTFP